jgi:hypothetical protein
MKPIVRENLDVLEDLYRQFATRNDETARQSLDSSLNRLRYELRMGAIIHLQYEAGMEEPMLMRILESEKDLVRWAESRFVRMYEDN